MIFLVDNGSRVPAAYVSLVEIAQKLEAALCEPVVAAPFSHAEFVLEDLLEKSYQAEVRKFIILPLFFGPSAAVTKWIPRCLQEWSSQKEDVQWKMGMPLFVDESDGGTELAEMLISEFNTITESRDFEEASVVLVDHGSPQEKVTEVRDCLGRMVHRQLPSWVKQFSPASMERRSGSKYDFNEPLLEHLLKDSGFNAGTVILLQLFLSPGRHAGKRGDIESICTLAEAENHGLRIIRSGLLGNQPKLISLLEKRVNETQSQVFRK